MPGMEREVPAIRRLDRLTPLDEAAIIALRAEVARSRVVGRGGTLVSEGNPIKQRLLILEGWAGRVRMFEDGRLQIMSFLLPGDLIGNCAHSRPLAVSTIAALTKVRFCAAPPSHLSAALAESYAVSQAMDEAHLLAHIARLGRLSAEERLTDLLLELHERLELCGLAENGRFEFPVTQNVLADATGLTVVHVNRMVRELRRQEALSWLGGIVMLNDPAALSRKLGRTTTCVNATN